MQLLDLIKSTGGISAIAQQVGLSEGQAQQATAALLPAILGGFKKQAAGGGGLEGLASMLSGAGGGGLLDNVLSPAPTNTGLGANILGQIFGSKDVSRDVASQAAQTTGLNADTLKKMLPILTMVVAGLLAKQSQGGAQQGGGGGGMLDQIGGMFGKKGTGQAGGGLGSMLDLDGDGNPLDDILGAAGKIFGR